MVGLTYCSVEDLFVGETRNKKRAAAAALFEVKKQKATGAEICVTRRVRTTHNPQLSAIRVCCRDFNKIQIRYNEYIIPFKFKLLPARAANTVHCC